MRDPLLQRRLVTQSGADHRLDTMLCYKVMQRRAEMEITFTNGW